MKKKKISFRSLNTRLIDPYRSLIPGNFLDDDGNVISNDDENAKVNVIDSGITESTEDYSLIHYSHSPREFLDPAKHGTGIKDAADKRLVRDGLDKSELKNRVYFYVKNSEEMPKREVGIGPIAHEVFKSSLKLFDPESVDQETRIKYNEQRKDIVNKLGVSEASAHELAVKRLGFDGYINRDYGFAVAIRDEPIKVDKIY